MKMDFRNDVIAQPPAPFWIAEAFAPNCLAHVFLHKLGIIIASNMADEQEEILETNDVNMDFRRMRQTHEVVKYVNYFLIN